MTLAVGMRVKAKSGFFKGDTGTIMEIDPTQTHPYIVRLDDYPQNRPYFAEEGLEVIPQAVHDEVQQRQEPCHCSECRMERARAHDTGGTFTDHNGYKFPEE